MISVAAGAFYVKLDAGKFELKFFEKCYYALFIDPYECCTHVTGVESCSTLVTSSRRSVSWDAARKTASEKIREGWGKARGESKRKNACGKT